MQSYRKSLKMKVFYFFSINVAHSSLDQTRLLELHGITALAAAGEFAHLTKVGLFFGTVFNLFEKGKQRKRLIYIPARKCIRAYRWCGLHLKLVIDNRLKMGLVS